MQRESTWFRAVCGMTRAAAVAERAMTAGARLIRDVSHGVLASALSRDERARLGVHLYDAASHRGSSGLSPWESEWFAADLPAPPSRILVGGAGDGREVRSLLERGYRVAAFDPRPHALTELRRLGEDQSVGTYEDLAAAVLDGLDASRWNAVLTTRWDAVVLGWTSFMHVIDDSERRRVLAALDRVCPGPMLLTFHHAERRRSPGPGYPVGFRVGRAIGHWRNATPARADESFGFGCGFLRGATPDEIGEISARIGRRAVMRGTTDGCVRMTLVREA